MHKSIRDIIVSYVMAKKANWQGLKAKSPRKRTNLKDIRCDEEKEKYCN